MVKCLNSYDYNYKFQLTIFKTCFLQKACKQAGPFTQTVFSPSSPLAITGTTEGKIILWDYPLQRKEKKGILLLHKA